MLLKFLMLFGDVEKARPIMQDNSLTDAQKIQLVLSLLQAKKLLP